jgi:uncharacterized OB-fold protein
MGRRNHLVRMRITKIMRDGQWRTAKQICERMAAKNWSFTSVQQIGNLCSNTPGYARRRSTDRQTYNLGIYRLESESTFMAWMDEG